MNFYIPPNVSLDGRVWKMGCIEVGLNTHGTPVGGLSLGEPGQHAEKNSWAQAHGTPPPNWRRLLTGD